ncbi:MAG: class I tRNA ligase family protein [Deltaproteobacteria bacterium]|nr:class I tRNA ligase family protein [Deltaproteobacteria bacterium]
MLCLFNTLGKKIEAFEPVDKRVVTIFTCGPSVYQRAHIGNFRTFLFEDILVRYLEYLGWRVERGMNITDIEDKAIKQALKSGVAVETLTRENMDGFLREMRLLRIKIPDRLPLASDHVEAAAAMIERLLELGVAYRHAGNVYFDPLKFPGFGKLFGLDMRRWPAVKRRFHRDTYPGTQWNLGDFILWHGYREEDRVFWDTPLGRGRPSWNIQDPSMVGSHFQETLSIYCGGIDNLYRHHDYSLAVLESLRPYPMARFWLHGEHLLVGGRKMSKSRGTVTYTDDLLAQGYTATEIRFFLIYGHYREKLSFSDKGMKSAAEKLRRVRLQVSKIQSRAETSSPGVDDRAPVIRRAFREQMDRDLEVRGALDALFRILEAVRPDDLKPTAAASLIAVLRETDQVLNVIF